MKKNLMSVLLVIVMIAALMVSVTGCGAGDDDAAARIAELEQENAQLQEDISSLMLQISQMQQRAALNSWELTAEAWADGNGATVTFSAIPVTYVEGQSAALSVRMNGLEAESTNCVWDGNAFVGSVELGAVDGYSYYCILTSGDGTQEEIELNSPENVTNETLVFLGSNLNTYANLIVEDWSASDESLVINAGYAQVQLPRLLDPAPTVTSSTLVLTLNGEEVARQDVTLPAGEGEDIFELALSGVTFPMPELEDDYQLGLQLAVTLSNGNTVTASAVNWYSNGGELTLVVG